MYLFTDAQGRVLYVGKAASLRARVSSYFHAPQGLSPRIKQLVARIADLQVTTTGSEAEALLLESQLIKRHHPKYNIAYRDDKSYPLLKLTAEAFPRLIVTRERRRDGPARPGFSGVGGGRYFGPYPDAGSLRQAVQFLRRVFPLRTCRTFPKSPCLEYHLGQCLAPCVGYIDEAAYGRIVGDLVAFLEGKREALLRELSRRMERASRDRRFEEAARLRDQIHALTSVIVAKEKSALTGPLEQLQLALKLPALPRRIEAFDISNIYGAFAVGSMVTFVEGRPRSAHYRHFKIRTVAGIDDCRMMREVIRRRYGGSLAADLPRPDLILVDGGKGQLHAAREALQALGADLPVIGLAKRFEEVFVPGQSTPVVLLPTSPVLHLIQRIRDEAHRFAIRYHRRLRAKHLLQQFKGRAG
ncbi:MAG: excinuclease ABC subunit UvrC [Candidatus Omnitrophica bacterium]|nr:excinuclease ABC subunit UvrC [Candidatus Omnitrophota bacterium]